MTKSKQAILTRLSAQSVPKVDLPEVIDGPWIEYPDRYAQFAEMIRLVGGSCQAVDTHDAVIAQLSQHAPWRDAKRVFSAVSEIKGNVDLEHCGDPHDLKNLDFVVYEGDLAVAENGAIWISDGNLKHRVVFFITQFLVLLVRRNAIVSTMHQAYSIVKPPRPGFGLFLSGPSKTADIEQSLVIGAHGCRELQVFVL